MEPTALCDDDTQAASSAPAAPIPAAPRMKVRRLEVLRLSPSVDSLKDSIQSDTAAFMVGKAKEILRAAGAKLFFTWNVSTFSHAVGTVRMGDDERTAPLDADCRFRGVENLCVTDGSGTVLEANPALSAHLGIGPHRLRGKPLSVFIAPEDVRTFRSALSDLGPDVQEERRPPRGQAAGGGQGARMPADRAQADGQAVGGGQGAGVVLTQHAAAADQGVLV